MKKFSLILIGAIYISVAVGCQFNTPVKRTYTMCPPSTWPDQHRQVALKSYLYAQMANNTYGQKGDTYNSDKLDFVLPSEWSFSHFPNDGNGFAYSIYKKANEGRLQEVVIAFRGTEGFKNAKDFIYGNGGTTQRKLAADLYKQERNKLNAEGLTDVPIILTGHSLGGALATHTAINLKEDVPYFVFNTSPRINKFNWSDLFEEKDINNRHSIVETAEPLGLLRFPSIEPNQTYTPFNCDTHFKLISSHGIEKLAKCLTMVAHLNDPAATGEMVPKSK